MRIFLCVLLVLTVAGCASTPRKPENDQLQSRVVELEKKLEEKDAEIVDLQYEVKDLSSKVESSAPASAAPAAAAKVPEAVVAVKGGDDIIRTGTTPEKVQTALKGAGFYSGRVDGKIGPGTKSAIIEFQKAQNLKADGVVGRKTWDALKQYLN